MMNEVQTPCQEPCDGQWFDCAKEILDLNNIAIHTFADALRKLMSHGRAKYRNLMIYGPSNSGKSFVLRPLQTIFKGMIFQNPSNDKYAWVGADKAKVFLLNDFRWSADCISWSNLLLLLEGDTVKLPAPKNHFAEDILIQTDVPIFLTCRGKITLPGDSEEVSQENKMMEVRFKYFNFTHQFEEKDQKDVPPCGKCFGRLMFS